MSGFYGVDSTMFLSQIAPFLKSYLAAEDSFKIIVDGAGLFDTFPHTGWLVLMHFLKEEGFL